MSACPLCEGPGGTLIAQTPHWRLVRADEPGFPAFYRVIWAAHVAEMSDLGADERRRLMDAVWQVEAVLRRELQPRKINLASLGNVVPHLHWHVIARFDWDERFPAPVWAPVQRAADPLQLAALQARLPACDRALREALQADAQPSVPSPEALGA